MGNLSFKSSLPRSVQHWARLVSIQICLRCIFDHLEGFAHFNAVFAFVRRGVRGRRASKMRRALLMIGIIPVEMRGKIRRHVRTVRSRRSARCHDVSDLIQDIHPEEHEHISHLSDLVQGGGSLRYGGGEVMSLLSGT